MALDKTAFSRILRDHPQFATSVMKIAKERYNVEVLHEHLIGDAAKV